MSTSWIQSITRYGFTIPQQRHSLILLANSVKDSFELRTKSESYRFIDWNLLLSHTCARSISPSSSISLSFIPSFPLDLTRAHSPSYILWVTHILSLMRMSLGTHRNKPCYFVIDVYESWRTQEWVTHLYISQICKEILSTIPTTSINLQASKTHQNEAWYAYVWVMSHICMSHVTDMYGSRQTYVWITSHMWMRHISPARGGDFGTAPGCNIHAQLWQIWCALFSCATLGWSELCPVLFFVDTQRHSCSTQ